MVPPASSSRPRDDVGEERAQAPIRWPHLNAVSVGLVVLWAVGVFVAIFVPALIVSPSARTAPPREVWTAFTATIVGAGIMITAASLLWRRSRDVAYFIMGAVPAFAGIAGGAIFAGAKLSGT
jgi:hypothetical protein